MLNARRRFLAAAFAPVLNNVVVIAVFLVLPRIASGSLTVDGVLDDDALVLLIGLGTTAGVVVMALALLPPLGRLHVHLRFLPAWRHPAVLHHAAALGVDRRVRDRQPDRAAGRHRAGERDRWRPVHLHQRVRVLPAAARPVRGVAHDDLHAGDGERGDARDDLDALRAQLSRGLRLAAVVDRARGGALRRACARPIIVALLQRGAFSGWRRLGRRRHIGHVRGRPAALLHLPLRDARVLRRATTRSRRSGSTASRTR